MDTNFVALISTLASTQLNRDYVLKVLNDYGGLWQFIALLLLVAGGIIAWTTGFFSKIKAYILSRLRKALLPDNKLPRETLRVIPQPNQAYWNFGTQTIGKRKKKIIIISCKFYVTNITKGDILITATYMKKPRSESVTPMVEEPPSRSHYWGRYPILAATTTEMQASYVLDKSVCRKGQDLVGDISVIDQLGNEHVVKDIKFKSR